LKQHSPQVDAYIERAPEYARPILKKIRKLFHQACPALTETLKWGVPSFSYKGIVGNMAAFKQHVSIGFWKTRLLSDPHGLFTGTGTSMSAVKYQMVADLPPDKVLLEYIRAAVALNEQGIKEPKKKKPPRPEPAVPDYFQSALNKNKKALATFTTFSPSHKREYIEWLTEAKQDTTRQKRLAQAIEWLAEGKPRNWKYMNCR
jgi:uncharacterized protein YdeI (YjbR/CyaY-like superfamily)